MMHTLKAAETFTGALLGRSGNFLIGWARNLLHSELKVAIDIIGDEQWLGTTHTGLSLESNDLDLPVPAEANGHGFAFPVKARDWQSISRFEARVTNLEQPLPGVVFSYLDEQITPQVNSTHVAYDGGLRIQGWALDTLDPENHQEIFAFEGGRLLASCVANKHCAELEATGFSKRNYGFSLTLPMEIADGCVHEIQVSTGHGQVLTSSPLQVFVPEGTVHAWINSLALPQQERNSLNLLIEQLTWQVNLSVDFSCYPAWFERYGNLSFQPVPKNLSILIAVTGSGDMEKTLHSLINQSHPDWRVLVCRETGAIADPRVSYINPNAWEEQLKQQLRLYTVACFITIGDTLQPDALAALVNAFQDATVQIVYTDCDHAQASGQPPLPWFKPDWDPDLFLASTPLHHLFAVRSANLPINDPHIAEPDAWPWLAVTGIGDDPKAIHHIPRVLYHRNTASWPIHHEAQNHCDAVLAPGIIRAANQYGDSLCTFTDPALWPSVSLIIPTRDHEGLLRRCIESVLETDYPNLEILVVDNDSSTIDALDYLAQIQKKGIRILRHPGAFNFSAINNRSVQQAQSSIIGLVNNDIEAIDPQWLKIMVRQLLRPNVGVVGAKLLWPNGMVQHAGVTLGLHGLAGHAGNDWHKDDRGYFGYNQITRSTSAVTAACLLCRREDYLAVDGMDENDFPVNFNDVDFCLKLSALGKRIVWSAEAQLLHAESASRRKDDTPERRGRLVREKNRLMQKWRHWIIDDPLYNPNLNLDAYSYAGLAMPPRGRAKTDIQTDTNKTDPTFIYNNETIVSKKLFSK
jgi:O-antigen biosynthesis protein